jgi:hypothetical protein
MRRSLQTSGGFFLLAAVALSFACVTPGKPAVIAPAVTPHSVGDREKAPTVVDAAPESHEKTLELACHELDTGANEQALQHIEAVKAKRPAAYDVRILEALAKERIAAPKGSWWSAVVRVARAIKDEPDEHTDLVLIRPEDFAPDKPAPTGDPDSTPGPDGFLVRFAQSHQHPTPALREEVFHYAEADAPFAVHLVVFSALSASEFPAGDEARRAAARRAVLQLLLKERPELVYLRVRAAFDGPSEVPLSAAEFDALDAAFEGKDRSLSLLELVHAFEDAFDRTHAKCPQDVMGAVFFVYPVFPIYALTLRAHATEKKATPHIHARLAALLEKSARLLLESRTSLDRTNAISWLSRAQKLAPRPALAKEIEELRAQSKLGDFDSPSLLVVRMLPLPSMERALLEEQLTDEFAFSRGAE